MFALSYVYSVTRPSVVHELLMWASFSPTGGGPGEGGALLREWGAGGTPAGGPGGEAPWWGGEGGEAPPNVSRRVDLNAKRWPFGIKKML